MVSPVLELYEIGELIKKTCGDKLSLVLTVYGFVQNTTADVERDNLNILSTLLVSVSTFVSRNNNVITPTLYPYVPYLGFGLMLVYPTNPI